MSGWTMKPRKPGTGCHGCGEQRGEVVQALIARPTAGVTLWLCTGCARVAARRHDFGEEYARRCGLPPTAPDRADVERGRAEPETPRRRRDER